MRVFIIIACFGWVALNAAYGAVDGDVERELKTTPVLPHYDIDFAEASGLLVEQGQVEIMNRFFAGLGVSDADEEFKRLFADCEVAPAEITHTGQRNTIYFVRKKSKDLQNARSSHWVIKQLVAASDGEHDELNHILQLLHAKRVPSGLTCKHFKFAMPECTFLMRSNSCIVHFTLYHRVRSRTLYDFLRNTAIDSEPACALARQSGELLFALHDKLRPSQGDLRALARGGQVNVARLYSDIKATAMELSEPVWISLRNPLLRMVLTRCIGDFHGKNVIVNGNVLSVIDYTTLSREVSLFSSELGYAMFCGMYFHGRNFIKGAGVKYLSNFLAGYFAGVHPYYREIMLDMTKSGFVFFVDRLASNFTVCDYKRLKPEPCAQPCDKQKFVQCVIQQLNSIFFHSHGITSVSTDEQMLAAVQDFCTTKQMLRSAFVDDIISATKVILATDSWKEVQIQALDRVRKRRSNVPPYYKFNEPISGVLARFKRMPIEHVGQAMDDSGKAIPIELAVMLKADKFFRNGEQHILKRRSADIVRSYAGIYGPYMLNVPHAERLARMAEQARFARMQTVDTFKPVMPYFIVCNGSSYTVYKQRHLKDWNADIRMPLGDYCEKLKVFGEQLFNWHQMIGHVPTSKVVRLSGEILGRPITDPKVARYLIVNHVVVYADNVLFFPNRQSALVYPGVSMRNQFLRSFIVDVGGYIRSLFSKDIDQAVIYAAYFLDGYLQKVPDGIAREHMLPDLSLSLSRNIENGKHLFSQIIDRTRFTTRQEIQW